MISGLVLLVLALILFVTALVCLRHALRMPGEDGAALFIVTCFLALGVVLSVAEGVKDLREYEKASLAAARGNR